MNRDDTTHRATLATRRKKASELDRATLRDAKMVRAGIIGTLSACECCYPLLKAQTESEHPEWCVSNALYESAKRAHGGE